MPETMTEIQNAKAPIPTVESQPAVMPTSTPTAEVKPEVKETPKEDIVSRASKVKLEEPKKEPTNPFGLSKEDYDKVQTDPTLSKFYKSMNSDYLKKTQEVAEQRRYYEQKLTEAGKWTPQKVQEIMNDQNFVQAANQVLQGQPPKDFTGTQQEWSALNESEKQKMIQLEQGYKQMSMQLALEQQRKQDETLKTRYANYDPSKVDIITNELLQGKRNATREDLWKAVDYENAIQRAYELGRQDSKPEIIEKANAASFEGMQMNPPTRVEPPKKEESNSSALKRIMLENIAKLRQR